MEHSLPLHRSLSLHEEERAQRRPLAIPRWLDLARVELKLLGLIGWNIGFIGALVFQMVWPRVHKAPERRVAAPVAAHAR